MPSKLHLALSNFFSWPLGCLLILGFWVSLCERQQTGRVVRSLGSGVWHPGWNSSSAIFLPMCPWAGNSSSMPQFPHLQKGPALPYKVAGRIKGSADVTCAPVCNKYYIHVTYCSLVILVRTKGEMALGATDSWPGVVPQLFSFSLVESPCSLSLCAMLLCYRPEDGLWSGDGFPHLSVGIRKML